MFQNEVLSLCSKNSDTSGFVDKTALIWLETAAPPVFDPISTALGGISVRCVGNFLPDLAEAYPVFFKKIPRFSACIVLALTIIVFSLLL